jgi:hypothetical protein
MYPNDKPSDNQCECCDSQLEKYSEIDKMWLCLSCIEREAVNRTARHMEQVGKADDVITKAKKIDTSMSVRTDIFNSTTIALTDVKKAIDADETVVNKTFKYAEYLIDKIRDSQKLIFEATETQINESNKQRAAQTILNTIANELRQEERNKLRLQDIEYKPKTLKPAKIKPVKIKLDMEELARCARELNVPMSMIQGVALVRNMTARDAAEVVRKTMGK